ncbi:hypothetical protein [Streptomyces sp. NPDC007856]|uniref:hypothetical protein n=1 Tax=Streptomyces sp. NPDC007856 TaxID=3364781 RepID=UPI003689B448
MDMPIQDFLGSRSMFAAVDTHSDAYQAGQVLAPFTLAAIVLVILWTTTRKWRQPKPVTIPEDLEATAKLARERTRRVVIGTVVIVVAATAMAAPYMHRSDDFGNAASKGPTNLTITPPTTLGSYKLMTGTQADLLNARIAGKLPKHYAVVFYTTASKPTQPVVEVFSDTSTTDPQLAQELAQYSADYEDTDLMAGARITDAKVFNPGSASGKMQCGQNNVELLCGWADSGTVGGLISNLTTGLNVQQIASLTQEFRAAAEH